MRQTPARHRILLVESGRSVGGTERVVWELATRLPASRFDVHLWLSPAPALDEFAAALETAGFAVSRMAEVDSRWDWKGMLATWRRLRALRPDLVHVHHVWPAADRYLAMLVRAAGVRHLVVTEHIVGQSHSGGQRALKRNELLRAGAVTAVCGAIEDTLVRDYGVERSRIRIVPNGADLPAEADEAEAVRQWRERFASTLLRPLWVVAGRLEEQKGHAVLFEALARLRQRGLDFTLAVAGDGSLRTVLEQQAESLGLGHRVRFLGTLDDVGPLLGAADAVVMPSLWEGLPLVLLEALVRARPVVASDVGGVGEVMAHDEHGELVPAGDADALADALERIHQRPDRALRLGRAGAERVRLHYTWPAVAEGFEAVYDEVLGMASVTPQAASGATGAGR